MAEKLEGQSHLVSVEFCKDTLKCNSAGTLIYAAEYRKAVDLKLHLFCFVFAQQVHTVRLQGSHVSTMETDC